MTEFITSAARARRAPPATSSFLDSRRRRQRAGCAVGQKLVDGVLRMEVQLDDSRVAALRELNIPFALIGRTCDVTGLHYVDIVPALPTDRLSTSSLRCRQTVRSGRDAAMELVARAPDTTAVLIVDEAAAAGLVSELAQMGRAVPGDISMMSSRDMAAICNPPLTTVTAPGTELGRLGVEALLRQLDGGTPLPPVLPAGVLARGESTGPIHEKAGLQ